MHGKFSTLHRYHQNNWLIKFTELFVIFSILISFYRFEHEKIRVKKTENSDIFEGSEQQDF